MTIEVPAYQAAGAIRKYLDEAEVASVAMGEDVRAAIAFNAEIKEMKDAMSMSTWLEMIELVANRLNSTSRRLELHHDQTDLAEEFFAAAEAMADDHRNTIAVPQALVDVVLPYLDDAFEDFVQCLYDIGAEMVEEQGIEREAIRASVPRFAPKVEITDLFAA